MSADPAGPARGTAGGGQSLDPALADALRALLGPMARLALAQGVSFAALEEMLKEAVVDEALKAQSAQTPSRVVSRISVATGLNRREVTRLTQHRRDAREVRHPPAAEVFTRWLTDPACCDGNGVPRPLPRLPQAQGEPSFESLAHSVTRDVHPRSLLDELCRLGIARLDGPGSVCPRQNRRSALGLAAPLDKDAAQGVLNELLQTAQAIDAGFAGETELQLLLRLDTLGRVADVRGPIAAD